jgi:hypothetical protein
VDSEQDILLPASRIRKQTFALDAPEQYSEFADAKTIDGAVGAFVSDAERPDDIPGQTAEREQIAKALLAQRSSALLMLMLAQRLARG